MYRRPHAGAVLTMCTLHALTIMAICCPMTLNTISDLFGMRVAAHPVTDHDAVHVYRRQSIRTGCLTCAKIDALDARRWQPRARCVLGLFQRLAMARRPRWRSFQLDGCSRAAHLGAARWLLLCGVRGRLRDHRDGHGVSRGSAGARQACCCDPCRRCLAALGREGPIGERCELSVSKTSFTWHLDTHGFRFV